MTGNMETRLLLIATCVLLLTTPLGSTPLTSEGSPSDTGGALNLERIFSSDEFETKHIGPVRWLKDGVGFTVLEDLENSIDGDSSSSAASEEERPREIVRYDCETGERTVMVPLAWLTPERESPPLSIDG
jgi:dipeptidyl-peptidase 4